MGYLSNEEKKDKTEYLFFLNRPVAVVVFAKNKKEAKAIQKQVLSRQNEDEEYVTWFDGIPGLDRALMTNDPVEVCDKGRIVEY